MMARVLVVEDIEPVRAFAERQLAPHYDVLTAQTMAEAEAILRLERFDCIIADLTLPNSEGAQTIRRVRALEPSRPLIAWTAHEDYETALAAIHAGASRVVVKGRTPNLVREVDLLIEQHREEGGAMPGEETRGAMRAIDQDEAERAVKGIPPEKLRKKRHRSWVAWIGAAICAAFILRVVYGVMQRAEAGQPIDKTLTLILVVLPGVVGYFCAHIASAELSKGALGAIVGAVKRVRKGNGA